MGPVRPGWRDGVGGTGRGGVGFPTVIVAQAWLGREDVAEVLAAQASFDRVRGVREKPAVAPHPNEVVPYAPGSMSDPEWQKGYARLEYLGLSFDLQAPFWHLPEARAPCRAVPGDHDHPRSLRAAEHP